MQDPINLDRLNTRKQVVLQSLNTQSIKPCSDEEKQVLQLTAITVFKEFAVYDLSTEELKNITKEIFLSWRKDKEICIFISVNHNHISTDVFYGYGATNYSDFAEIDKKNKKKLLQTC